MTRARSALIPLDRSAFVFITFVPFIPGVVVVVNLFIFLPPEHRWQRTD